MILPGKIMWALRIYAFGLFHGEISKINASIIRSHLNLMDIHDSSSRHSQWGMDRASLFPVTLKYSDSGAISKPQSQASVGQESR